MTLAQEATASDTTPSAVKEVVPRRMRLGRRVETLPLRLPSKAALCFRVPMRRGAIACAALSVSLLVIAGRAEADPTAADKETARRLMAEGRAHRDAKDFAAALQSFQAADALMHVPTTGLEVARTEIALGQLVEARDKLIAVTRIPQVPNEPKPFVDARTAAQALSTDVAARIPTLKVTLQGVPPGATAKVLVDGAEIPPAALLARRTLDPGHHVISARVGDGDPKTAEVDLAEKASEEVALDLSVTPGTPSSEAPPSTEAATEAAPENPSRDHTLAFIGFGVGAAGLLTGSITGVLAISNFNSAKSEGCVGTRCPPASYSALNTANTMATVSTVGFIVAGVGAVVGVVGLFVGKPTPPPAPEASAPSETGKLEVHPWLGLGSAGLSGTF
jgi:hypothetical protein